MLNANNVIALCCFAVLLTEVTSWTIDLPIARKFYFERSQQKHHDHNRIYFGRGAAAEPYDNIDGDSPHNSPQRPGHEHYAQDYGYLSYMEKKVHGIYLRGDHYLEGLRGAVLRYSQRLQNCSRADTDRSVNNSTWAPEPPPAPPARWEEGVGGVGGAGGAGDAAWCAWLARDGEHVRRLAALVLWAARELQDLAYARDYGKASEAKESEEYALLLQLAWALDELARRTGFQPDAALGAAPTPAPAPTTTPNTYFNLPIPNDGPLLANCVKQPSPVPATVRCAVPVPAAVLQMLNMTNSTALSGAQAQDMIRMIALFNSSGAGAGQPPGAGPSLEQLRAQWAGCLRGAAPCADFVAFLQFLNENGQFQNSQPRPNREADSAPLEILEEAEQNVVAPLRASRRRRSAPLREVALYLGKYKAWAGANAPETAETRGSYDVENHLTPVKTIRKRSVGRPGVVIRVPEDPLQDLSAYARHAPHVRYVSDATQANLIKAYLDKLYHKDIGTAKDHVKKLDAAIRSVHKRSVHYRRLHRPRVPEDPQQDISSYVKSKPGTNIRRDALNAARVRLGLQQIFERGNLAVVHRYGSNYVPGVRPLEAGGVQSTADI